MFQSITTGASNDIERATSIARSMITMYGMSDRFGLVTLESVQDRYLDGRAVMNCSETTGAQIDEEVQKVLRNAYERSLAIIKENRDVLDEIAAFLIERENITGKEFMEIFNRRNSSQKPEEIMAETIPAEESEPPEE